MAAKLCVKPAMTGPRVVVDGMVTKVVHVNRGDLAPIDEAPRNGLGADGVRSQSPHISEEAR